MRVIVGTWFGAYLVDGDRVLRSHAVPLDAETLLDRIRTRREGRATPEEAALISERGNEEWTTVDRRLAGPGIRWDPRARANVVRPDDASETLHREVLLEAADAVLKTAWDPSIHVEEAVRAAADLDRARNLVGERLGSWVARDAPELTGDDAAGAATRALAESDATSLAPTDPELRAARRRLAELYREIESVREALERAVESAVPRDTPNLNALLGPELAARLLAQAGGLARLARLPASTVQVLGAERAFFEHLRGRAPPPRHGLLFLHPSIQSAPRRERGKLARAIAGKVAIAARLDRAGRPVDPSLAAAFEARRATLKAARDRTAGKPPRPRSRPPLHRAAGDR